MARLVNQILWLTGVPVHGWRWMGGANLGVEIRGGDKTEPIQWGRLGTNGGNSETLKTKKPAFHRLHLFLIDFYGMSHFITLGLQIKVVVYI